MVAGSADTPVGIGGEHRVPQRRRVRGEDGGTRGVSATVTVRGCHGGRGGARLAANRGGAM